MANIKPNEQDSLPKTGRVTEVCKEWSVREDGALAYQLQKEEITDHLQSNRFRNAVVRQDFPKAVDEQLREQQLAEQAAAVYHQMLAEQEEIDNLYAKQLAQKIQREEKNKRQESYDQKMVRRRVVNSDVDVLESSNSNRSPSKVMPLHPSHQIQNKPAVYDVSVRSKRQGLAMPLPSHNSLNTNKCNDDILHDPYSYTEPYMATENLTDHLNRIDIAELGLPLEEISQRELQEQKDAFLARQLQQQEDSSELSQLNRDRLLAIEAQDKELAKLLQERERQKAKRAKERARQKALSKKQVLEQDVHQIMPDDSYSNPADLLPSPQNSSTENNSLRREPKLTKTEDEINYSFPVDVLPSQNYDSTLKKNYTAVNTNSDYQLNKSESYNSPEKINSSDVRPPTRPNRLDLKVNYASKPRYPDPEFEDTNPLQHTNIAMAIDPTYNRRNYHSYYDTSSSTVSTSTSSSSPGIKLPPPDVPDFEDEVAVAPPYMPIQGQRRTASLEKKSKKKDGCKQQ